MLCISEKELYIFLFVKKPRNKDQWKNYKATFGRIQEYFRRRDFNVQNIGEYIVYLQSLNYSSATIFSYMQMMKYLCEILGVDCMKEFKRPHVHSRKKNYLYPEEMSVFLNEAYIHSYRLALACELSLRHGLRYEEVSKLMWEDFSGEELTLKDTKSQEDQSIYLTADIADKIHKLNIKEPYIFGRHGGRVTNRTLNLFVRRVRTLCHIEKYFTFHDLRHSCASDLADKDVNMFIIKEYMRHKNIQTTERYCHTTPRKLKETAFRHTLSRGSWRKEDIVKEAEKFIKIIQETKFRAQYKTDQSVISIKIKLC